MSARKPGKAEVEQVAAAPVSTVGEEPPVSVPPVTIPPGNPLTWTLEQALIAAQVPVDKLTADLSRQAGRQGVLGIPAQMALNIWTSHVSPANIAALAGLAVTGLVQTVASGKGHHGHSDAEMV